VPGVLRVGAVAERGDEIVGGNRRVIRPDQVGIELERPDLARAVGAPLVGGGRDDRKVLVQPHQRFGEQVGIRACALVDGLIEVERREVGGVVVGSDEHLLVGRGGIGRRSGGGGRGGGG